RRRNRARLARSGDHREHVLARHLALARPDRRRRPLGGSGRALPRQKRAVRRRTWITEIAATLEPRRTVARLPPSGARASKCRGPAWEARLNQRAMTGNHG